MESSSFPIIFDDFSYEWSNDYYFLLHMQVCPICASQPGGEPNHVTDDFAAHLALEHRRVFISFS